MADVEIVYEARVRGQERVNELAQRTRELSSETHKAAAAADNHAIVEKKRDSALQNASKSLRNFRREMFIVSAAVAAAAIQLKFLADASDSFRVPFEKIDIAAKSLAGSIGNALSPAVSQAVGFFTSLIIALDGLIQKTDQFIQKHPKLQAAIDAATKGGIPGAIAAVVDPKSAARIAAQAETARNAESLRQIKQREDFTIRRLKAEGDVLKSLDLQHVQETRLFAIQNNIWDITTNRVKANDKLTEQQKIQLELLGQVQGVERERLRLSEMNLKNARDIAKEFRNANIQTFKAAVSGGISETLTGKIRSREELMGFVSSIGGQLIKNASNAFAEALAAKVFGGKSFGDFFDKLFGLQSEKASEKERQSALLKSTQNQEGLLRNQIYSILQSIQNCVCQTAAMVSSMAPQPRLSSVTIEGGGGGSRGLAMAQSIVGGIGRLASMGAGIGGGGLPAGAGIGGGGLPAGSFSGASTIAGSQGGFSGITSAGSGVATPSSLSIAPGAFPVGHQGGWFTGSRFMRSYQAGGEVPAILHAGEFVVNARSAQANKEVLNNINQGKSGGGGNTFLVKINANDSRSFDEQLATPAARNRMEMQIIRAIMTNSEVRRVIRDFAK